MSTLQNVKRDILQFGHGGVRRLPLHRNEGLEIVYISKGTLLWQTDGIPEVVAPNSIFFTLPWQEHGSALDYEPGHEWYFAQVRLKSDRNGVNRVRFPRWVGLTREDEAAILHLLIHSKRHGFPASDAMRGCVVDLVEELIKPTDFHASRVGVLFAEAVVELARCIAGTKAPMSVSRRRDDMIRNFVAVLAERCEDPWTLAEMARFCGLKRTQFASILVRMTGDTPQRLLNRLRVQKARQLLLKTKLSVTEISVRCGFSSTQYFALVFKRFVGRPASAYRAMGNKMAWV